MAEATYGPGDRPWRMASLTPLPEAAVRGFVPDLPVEIVVAEPRTPDGVRAAVADADLVLGDFTGTMRIDASVLAAGQRIAFIQQSSVGVEHIDLEACAAAGIPVANVAGANAVAVAEWCLLGALGALRSAVWADGQVRAGGWPQLEMVERGCVDLAGKRVGIIGFGAIGLACAKRFAAMDCPVSYWSRRRRPDGETAGATYRDLDDLVRSSDVLVVVVARAPETVGLLGAERLALLPRGAVLVNAARGGLVDEAALLRLLDDGHLAAAALDVYDVEPPAVDDPIRSHEKVFLSPHIAGGTVQSRLRILSQVTANLRRAVHGEPVQDVVNDIEPLVRRRGPA
ncbi:MAG TPA: NAD(P)-dependent oxidoreductase [Mycobacteriales bacterium]|nr:NAD(P)-dependent oxidoreductase [Mycobacteriales bacterium]